MPNKIIIETENLLNIQMAMKVMYELYCSIKIFRILNAKTEINIK